MKKHTHFVGFKLDDETLSLLQGLIERSGKNKKSAVIRHCIQEQAKRTLNK